MTNTATTQRPARERSGDRANRAWRKFAHELCEALEDADTADELDHIKIPFDGITAREWLQIRREKREGLRS